jgi:hypothetical protein
MSSSRMLSILSEFARIVRSVYIDGDRNTSMAHALHTCVAAGASVVHKLASLATNLSPAGVVPVQTVSASRAAAARGPQASAGCTREFSSSSWTLSDWLLLCPVGTSHARL